MAKATYAQQKIYEEVYDICRLMTSPRFPKSFKWMDTVIEYLVEGTETEDGVLKDNYWKATDRLGREYWMGFPHQAAVGIVSLCEGLPLGRVTEPMDL
ncbi:hypothetical protein [Cohnella panacarvi]|uniref:hypothetical protein n=1 Tax=Cohnella panacarvi TaxID=400776 RepID=UPI0004795312|nr:hypothetical protein [Cohnella panacarvi]